MKIRHLFSCQEGILGFLDVTYYIASVFGMAPYTRFLNNNGKYEYKPERISWGNASPIIFITVSSTCCLCIIETTENIGQISFAKIMLFVYTFSEYLTALAVPYMFFFRQESILAVFHSFKAMDDLFSNLRLHFSSKIVLCFTLFVEVSIVISLPMVQVLNQYVLNVTFASQFPKTIGYYGAYFLRGVPMYYLVAVCALLSVRLHFLGEEVQAWKATDSKLERKLSIVASIYERIGEVADHVNDAFAWSQLCTIIQASLGAILLVFALFESDKRSGEYAFWAVMLTCAAWIISLVCEFTCYKCKIMVGNLASVDISIESEVLVRLNKSLLLQIQHKPIFFSAAGLFNINVTIIAAHIDTLSNMILFLMEMRKQSS